MFFQLANKLKNIVNAIISINLEVDSSEAFQIIVRETCKVLECDRASVFLVNPNTNELWTKSAKGSGVIKVDFGQGLVGFVANTMKSLNILEAHKDCRFNPEIDRRNNYNTKSVLCVPVIDPEKGTLVGKSRIMSFFFLLLFDLIQRCDASDKQKRRFFHKG